MKKLFPIIAIAIFLTSCQPRVNPNEWVVSTSSCWNTMTVTKAGEVIPRLLSSCDRMVILPATDMSAEFTAKTKFEKRVAGEINVTYQWRISDPSLFIKSAKSIISSPTVEGNKIDPNALEGIENSVVDKMLVDIIREYTPQKEAGTDEKEIEKSINELCEGKFNNRGVEIYNMSINVDYSSQTEEALDVISALKFYEANGELELGKKVIEAKAGASHITINK